MKTPMNVFNTAMKKKKKNRKGFSLVELIVVLVIMAILAAALVPTLIGYIKQTKQSNAKNEAAAVVSAAQTIASSAYASGDGKYYDQSNNGTAIQALTASDIDAPITHKENDADKGADNKCPTLTTIASLAEIEKTKDGAITSVSFSKGVVTKVQYTSGGTNVEYTTDANGKGTYEIVDNFS